MLFYTHLTMLFLAFGPPYIPALLSLLLPRRYLATSAPQVLKAYCVYLPVMGFNGFLEAFVSSTAEEKDLRRQSQWMIVFSVVFALSGWGFMKVLGLGEVGLVWANAVNLGCRAIYGMIFVLQYFQARATKVSVRSSIPPFAVLAAFAISAGVVRWSEEQFGLHAKLKHVVVGGTFFLFSAIVT
jgi:oligosaccharide translocation protein RFT1